MRPEVCIVRTSAPGPKPLTRRLLAVARDHEQAVVDRQAEAEPGHEIEREHRDVGKARDDAQGQEGEDDGQAAEQRRQQGGHERAEEQQREQEDEGKGQELGVGEVVADLGVGLGVGERLATELDVASARRMPVWMAVVSSLIRESDSGSKYAST